MRLRNQWTVLAGSLVLIMAGCSSKPPPASTPKAAMSPTGFPPTDPARVELIPWAPLRVYQRLGEITITPSPQSTRQDLDTALREAAAAVGAHAVFIVSDHRHQLEMIQVDPLLEEKLARYPTNSIVAVAIRY